MHTSLTNVAAFQGFLAVVTPVTFRIEIAPRAKKELDALDGKIRNRIIRSLARLESDPFRSANVKALNGGGFRLRVGDYRVLYEVENTSLLVLVVKIGHRRDVYRG